jgi:arylsulfatase A-like enzyme
MFKRYSYQGGVCDPLVIHWPAGIQARGQVRHQYHHATDIVPPSWRCAASSSPRLQRRHPDAAVGVSMRSSFDADPDGPTRKQTQH